MKIRNRVNRTQTRVLILRHRSTLSNHLSGIRFDRNYTRNRHRYLLKSKHNQVTKETLEVKNNKSVFVTWGWNRRASNRFLLLRSTTVSSFSDFISDNQIINGNQIFIFSNLFRSPPGSSTVSRRTDIAKPILATAARPIRRCNVYSSSSVIWSILDIVYTLTELPFKILFTFEGFTGRKSGPEQTRILPGFTLIINYAIDLVGSNIRIGRNRETIGNEEIEIANLLDIAGCPSSVFHVEEPRGSMDEVYQYQVLTTSNYAPDNIT
ncbi:hypothetical protein LXL04_023423 [Taraxacum kok-saghyz]